MDTFFHSVRLETERCKGCINCLKRCPTGAIRVRNGKASIIKEFCIDCGECIRICPHHAKRATYDPLTIMDKFAYKVALPPPSLYAQFNNLDDKGLVLDALLELGFDNVFEVSVAAEIVSEMTRKLLRSENANLPIISSACPSIVRLIRVRFPNLIDHISSMASPMEIAASIAVRNAMEETGLKREEIGIIFITPCPAKFTAVNAPLGRKFSEVNGVVAMSEIYPKLVSAMKKVYENQSSIDTSADSNKAGRIGISWGKRGGEASGLLIDSYLAADGIENVIRVLEDLEDDKLQNLQFIELNSCDGGCVGGVLAVENPFIAQVKLNALRKYLPVSGTHFEQEIPDLFQNQKIEYQPVYRLGGNFEESVRLMQEVEQLMGKLPGLDCGCCGAPNCRMHAEDVVRGLASEKDCIHILKKYIHQFADELRKVYDD